MEVRHVEVGGESPTDHPATPGRPRQDAPLVRWQRIAGLGEALMLTAAAPRHAAAGALPSLLDRLTRPHRLLEALESDANEVIAGDPLAARRLADRLATIAAHCPSLAGSTARTRRAAERAGDDDGGADHAVGRDVDRDEGSLAFDGLLRLAAAAAVATRERPTAIRHAALDVVLGLAMQASTADLLLRARAAGGAPAVARALDDLRLLGHPFAAPPPMRTMSGGPIGIPGLPPGPGPGGGFPGGGFPGGDDDVPRFVHDVVDRLRDRRHWDHESWDELPTWREIIGLSPIEEIDRGEIVRVRCMLAMIAALELRQEPPPPRPARVVWSDTITAVTADRAGGACAGDRIVIHGHDFGTPSNDVGVVLPMGDGCRPFAVPAADWAPTSITVTLPVGIASGPVGLVDLAYTRAHDDWAARMNALTTRILADAECARSTPPDVAYVLPFHECAPLTSSNRLRAGLPVVRSFRANGRALAVVEPGQPVRLQWSLANVDSFRLRRVSGSGPRFAGSDFVDDLPWSLYDLAPFTEKVPVTATYELSATGPCGTVAATVQVLLRKVPQIAITGIEVVQAVQTFRDPSAPPNSIPLVAHKDTIVRVYVAVENLGDFGPHGMPGEVDVSGSVRLTGPLPSITLPPINASGTARARPDALIDRRSTDHTLNFRIPSAAASSDMYTSLRVTVWTASEVESAPSGEKVRPSAVASQPIAWTGKAPYKVRYVRISTSSSAALGDAEARAAVVRAFDMLATPATDILPARLVTWHTSQDIDSRDGVSTLLGHIDDQHDCTLSEWLLPWEEDCPDADGAVWLGILPRPGDPAGIAQGYRLFDASRNTAIADRTPTIIAHELGHTLKLNHVNPHVICGSPFDDDTDFDTLPDGGAIRPGDAFDPTGGSVVAGSTDLHDVMTYACYTWISRTNWMRVFGKF